MMTCQNVRETFKLLTFSRETMILDFETNAHRWPKIRATKIRAAETAIHQGMRTP